MNGVVPGVRRKFKLGIGQKIVVSHPLVQFVK
jgi:hypothetical protein